MKCSYLLSAFYIALIDKRGIPILICSHCGEIKYAEMKERGTGLVRFINERDAERAMSVMDKHQIGNRAIEVRLY